MNDTTSDLRRQFAARAQAAPEPARASSAKRTMALTLLGIGAGALTLYAGYSAWNTPGGAPRPAASKKEDPEGKVFTSVEQCQQADLVVAVDCALMARQALEAHEKVAVAYDTREACEAENGVGRCANPQTSDEPRRRSSFIPVLAGYMLGRAMSGGQVSSTPLYSHPSDPKGTMRYSSAMPNYVAQQRIAADQARAADRARIGGVIATTRPAASPPAAAASGSTARGGFGATGAATAAASSSS